MTALSITASQVLPSTGPTVQGVGGAAITQGQPVYFASDGKWKLMQADGTAAEAGSEGYGIALSACGADGQPIVVALPGAVVILGAGAAPAAATIYFPGATAGQLVPAADLASTNKATPMLLGLTTNRVKILSGAYDAGSVVPS